MPSGIFSKLTKLHVTKSFIKLSRIYNDGIKSFVPFIESWYNVINENNVTI